MKSNDLRRNIAKDKRKVNLGNHKNYNNQNEKYYSSNKKSNVVDIKSAKRKTKQKETEVKPWGCAQFLYLFIAIFFIFWIFIGANKNKEYIEVPYSGFTGEKYFKELGITKNDKPVSVEDNVEEANLVEMDNICLGKAKIDNENMYRFQVNKEGEKSYDLEISEFMCNVNIINQGETPKVTVSKKVYKNKQGELITINFYNIYVQSNKIKEFQ